ncbi:MAG TPA: Fur family transcriptional regulator [Actinomycetota bacterium]|jgi:Fur family ferric uptake transcriptional regulator|nr:Fur family transcriptional regulator [Actinomycetota bacterium]
MDLEDALRKTGLRVTRQRSAILDALRGKDGFTTAQSLFHELRRRKAAPGLATIYRTLSTLAGAGALDTRMQDGEQAFRLCGDRHHHHLVCDGCGSVEEVTSAEVESWVSRLAKRKGFLVTGHSADVYGLCASCR